jgi:dTDP-4-dehydrorhamnose 3,5-epimerase
MSIQGVEITQLKRIPDERGCIMHMIRNDAPHFEKFGEIYFSMAYPGVIKGWHEHISQIQNYAVVMGMIKLVMYDNRKNSPTYKNLMEIFVGELNYCLVRIPVGVINGYKCISTSSCLVANCATEPFIEGEMLRYDPLGDKVPYSWPIEMK